MRPTYCNYPDNSAPVCQQESLRVHLHGRLHTRPLPQRTQPRVRCVTPNVICDDNCVASSACPSRPSHLQKALGWQRLLHRDGPACLEGPGARAWECVNTARGLESCECACRVNTHLFVFISIFKLQVVDTCVLPLTPFAPIGQDCTALPGVADLSCLSGECVVHRCMS